MDPISIATTVGSVVMTCASVVKSVNEIIGKFSDAPMTMTAIASECLVLSAALSHIQDLATQNADAFVSRLKSQSNFTTIFDTALAGCALVFSVLDTQIQEITKGKDPGDVDRIGKAKAVWKEDSLKELLQQLRGQQIAINLLLTALQYESTSEIRDLLQKNNGVMQNVFRRTNTLRITHNISISNTNAQNDSMSSAMSTLSLGSIQTSFDPTRQDLELLNGTNPLIETTPFLAFSMSKAVKANDVKVIERLLARGYDLNFPVPGGLRPLIVAAQNGSVNLVQQFLDSGADIHAIDHEKKTALLWAAEIGNEELTRILLDRGANIEARGRGGMSVLNQASFSGRVSVLRLLLKHHANVEAKDDDMMNCLHNAAQFGHYSAMQVLLQNGVTVDDLDKDKNTALHLASRSHNSAAVDLLVLYGANVDARDTYSGTPLHEATFKGDLDSMMVLIRSGATIDAQSEAGLTPLHIAAREGFADAADVLISNKACLTKTSKSGDTHLHFAAFHGHTKVIQCLLAKGAEIGRTNKEGLTAIHIAAARGHEAAAEALLRGGADINGFSKTERPMPPIFEALIANKPSMVEFLLQKGSPIDIKLTNDHATLLHVAAKLGREKIVELLLQQKAPVDIKDLGLRTPVFWAAAGNNAKIVRLLLARRASLTMKDENGFTPLHISAKFQQVESAKALLENKAKISATDNQGMTPLHIASTSGCATLVKIFVQDHGASVNAKDKAGNTPLHYAEKPEVVDILMQGKAKTEVKNNFHQAPLHIFAMHEHLEAAEMLIRRGAAVDCWDHEKVTPLMRAVFTDKPNMAELLLKYGASTTHKVGKNKDTVLHLAAERGTTAVIIKILDSGSPDQVNINIKNAENATPLYCAIMYRKNETARLLIDRGAWLEPTINSENPAGATPLILAAVTANWELVRLLCERGADVHAKIRKRGTTALHFAAAQGNLEMTKLLISKGASIRDTDVNKFCALDYAEKWAPTSEVVKYLRNLE